MGNFFDHPPTDPRILEYSVLKSECLVGVDQCSANFGVPTCPGYNADFCFQNRSHRFVTSDAAKSFSPVSTEIETHIEDLKWMVEWLDSYKPCLEPIRLALSSPSNSDLQEKAFQELKPNIVDIQKFYTKAQSLSEFIPLVLASLEAEGR